MSEHQLPQGWALSAIRNLTSADGHISDGDWVESKDQDPNGSIRLIQLADIGDGDFRNKSNRFMSEDKAAILNCTFLEEGDVLVARMPDPLGRACLFPGVGKPAVTVVDVCLIRVGSNSALTNQLLKYWINSPGFRGLISENASGTTRKRITRKKLEKFEVPVPPFAEQKVIADKLDTLLAQVENTKARLEHTLKILKRFRQSVLAAAVSGRLTEEWRETNQHWTPWESIPFAELLLQLRSGAGDKPNDDPEGTPILRSSAVRSMEIDFADIRYLAKEEQLKKDNYLKPGDLLFTRLSGSAEYVGNCAMVRSIDRQYQFPDRLFCARLKEPKQARFLEYFCASQDFREHIQGSLKSSAGHQRITLDVIKNAVVVMPSLEEQTEIVHRVDQLFAHADRIEQQVNNALARVNNLTQSILAKAFRGELTEQWRKDNPELISGENSAEALLERIKAERAAIKPAKRTRKTKAHV